MALRILIEGHLRNISTKLFENQPHTFREEDFLSFHYSHIMQNSPPPGSHVFRPINMAWRNFAWIPKNLRNSGHWEDAFYEVSYQLTHWLLRRRSWCTTATDGRRTKGDHNNSPWAKLRWAKNIFLKREILFIISNSPFASIFNSIQ